MNTVTGKNATSIWVVIVNADKSNIGIYSCIGEDEYHCDDDDDEVYLLQNEGSLNVAGTRLSKLYLVITTLLILLSTNYKNKQNYNVDNNNS